MKVDEESSFKKIAKSYKEIGPYLGLGTQLAVTIIALFFFGRWLDSLFTVEPLFTILGAFIGGAAGIYNFIKTVLNMNKTKKNEGK